MKLTGIASNAIPFISVGSHAKLSLGRAETLETEMLKALHHRYWHENWEGWSLAGEKSGTSPSCDSAHPASRGYFQCLSLPGTSGTRATSGPRVNELYFP